jgi:hypothetical protein
MALNALNILKHNQEKFGIVTVIDARMYSLTTGEPILELDTLKIANISSESSMKEVRGGQAATQLIIYDYARNINLEVQDALASLGSFQYLLGANIAAASDKHLVVTGEALDDDWTTDSTGAITLAEEPVEGTYITLVNNTKSEKIVWRVTAGQINGGVVTIPAVGGTGVYSGKADGSALSATWVDTDDITVYYQVAPEAAAEQITLTADSFSENVKLVGKTFLIDQATGQRRAAEIVIHNFHLSPTFTLAFDSEGDAGVFDFSGMALEDPNGNMLTVKYLAENYSGAFNTAL